MYFLYNDYIGTNFNKSSGEDTFKSSSTMKVVDQESITQRNSKPISGEAQSNQHKHSNTKIFPIGYKSSLFNQPIKIYLL